MCVRARSRWHYDRDGGAEDHGVTNAAQLRAAECAELAALSVRKFAFPWLGTREGARAAWGHIAACTHSQAIADRYRRELEAM